MIKNKAFAVKVKGISLTQAAKIQHTISYIKYTPTKTYYNPSPFEDCQSNGHYRWPNIQEIAEMIYRQMSTNVNAITETE